MIEPKNTFNSNLKTMMEDAAYTAVYERENATLQALVIRLMKRIGQQRIYIDEETVSILADRIQTTGSPVLYMDTDHRGSFISTQDQ